MRTTSIWLDKYPIVQPVSGSGVSPWRRELGDLAVIVRHSSNHAQSIKMWILQAKVDKARWQNAPNSRREIELYERSPRFNLFTSQHLGAQLIDTFDLKIDFPLSNLQSWRFWSFLLFRPNSAALGPPKAIDPSPIRAAWTSGMSSVWSFTQGIEAMMRGGGASADTQVRPQIHTEWTRLYHKLRQYAKAKTTTRLPRGRWMLHSFRPLILMPMEGGSPGKAALETTGFEAPNSVSPERFRERVGSFREQVSGGNGNDDAPPGAGEPPEDDGGVGIQTLVIDRMDLED